MKKLFVSLLLITAVVFLQFCSSSKKSTNSTTAKTKQTPKVTYAANIQPLIIANCSPCHIPPRGNKKALDTYSSASANIDDMVSRMQLNPTDRGFMPFKHPKLSDSTINAFVQWKKDGLLEK